MEDENFKESISSIINGIGNLLLITGSKNSEVSNNLPADKDYTNICSEGSYAKHTEEKHDWENPNNWENLIKTRGNKIYNFLLSDFLGYTGENSIG